MSLAMKQSSPERFPILILALISILLFSRALVHPTWLIHSPGDFKNDLVLQYANLKYFEQQSWQQFGQFPLWHPLVYGGMPYIGHPHNQLLYPFQLFFFLSRNTDMMFTYIYLITTFLAGLFTYLFLRKRNLSSYSALLGGLVYMGSGMLISHIENGTYNFVQVIALFPMVLYLLEYYFEKKNLRSAALLALGLAVQFYAGHPQLFAYSLMGLCAYGVFRYVQHEKTVRTKLLWQLGIAALLFFLLVAVQLLPMIDYTKHSQKSKGVAYSYAASFSLPPEHLITLLLPNFFGANWNNTYWGTPNYAIYFLYIGVIPLLLAILAVLYLRNRDVKFFGWTALVTLIFAIQYSPLNWLLYTVIPGFGFFRGASKALFLFVFSGAVLAAFGMEFFQSMWVQERKQAMQRFVKVMIVTLCLCIVGILVIVALKGTILTYGNTLLTARFAAQASGLHPLTQYQQLIPTIYTMILFDGIGLALFLFLGLALFHAKLHYSTKPLPLLLILFVILNYAVISFPMISAKDPHEIWQVPEVVKIIQQDHSLFRVLDTTSILHQYLSVRTNIQIVDGYQPLVLDHYNRFLSFITDYDPSVVNNRLLIHEADLAQIKDMNVLDLLNIKYILSAKQLNYSNFALKWDGMQHIYYTDSDQHIYLYENTAVLPRAFAVPNVHIIDDYGETKKALATFDPKQEMLSVFNTEQPLDNDDNYSEVPIAFYSPNKIVLQTNFTFPKYVVLSEVYDPGWKAYDTDGNETLIYQADYALRAIYVFDGEQTTTLVYDPFSYELGKWMTVGGVIALIGLLLFQKKSLQPSI